MKKIALYLLLFLAGCSPNSVEDFRHQGDALGRQLTNDLHEIHTREDLNKAIPKLKDRFDAIVDLLITAKEYRLKHPEEEIELIEPTNAILLCELKRIYTIEGGRDAIEKAQREALIRLDAFEKKKKIAPQKHPSDHLEKRDR